MTQVLSAPHALAFDAASQNRSFETAAPQDILRWAIDFFGSTLCMSTSFQIGGMALIDMLSKAEAGVPAERRVPVLFVDTGFHFPETLEFAALVRQRYALDLRMLQPVIAREVFTKIYGDDRLYERNPTECCRINKVEPMERALRPYTARIAALRRDSSPERAKIGILERRTDGIYLVHPLANWTREQSQAYLKEHAVPVHPLHAKGYKTIGCFPPCCTQPVGAHAPERAGRWTGTGKSECGLHLMGQKREAHDFSI